MESTAKIAGKEARMNIIKNYVSTLVDNIVMNGDKIEQYRKQNNIFHEGIVRFDKSGVDIFEA